MLLEHTLDVKRTDICPPAYYYFDDTPLSSGPRLPLPSRQLIAHLPHPSLKPRSDLGWQGCFDARAPKTPRPEAGVLGDSARTTPPPPETTGHGASANEKQWGQEAGTKASVSFEGALCAPFEPTDVTT